MQGRVVVIGSANVDLTVRVPRLPREGETISGGEFYTSFGGKGANQAVAAHRAGAMVRFIGRVGQDENGRAILRRLEELGLETDLVKRDPVYPSGVALIMVDAKGRNQIAVAPGANRNIAPEEVMEAATKIADCKVMLLQLEVPLDAVEAALEVARRNRMTTVLNPAPFRPLPKRVLSKVDVLVPNQGEALALAGLQGKAERDIEQIAGALLGTGVGEVIVTLGEKGALWVRGETVRAFPAFAVQAVDTTAAGDAFCGALACALSEGRSMEEAIPFALAAGALTVTRRGAQDSLPTREQIEAMLGSSYGISGNG